MHKAGSLRSDRARTQLGRYVANKNAHSSVATPQKGPPLGSLLNPHRNAFRFVSIGVSVEILRRKQSCFGDVAGRLQETGEIKNTLDATAKGNPYIHSCLWFFHSMIRENTDYVSKYCSPAAFHSPSRQAYTSRQSPSSRLQGFFCANLFVRDSVD
ncbi:hypothetical protein DY000_02049820 [Brassica cretica]|uniref:Uncharacterized protein n=1 Tax=Brassica cretica TaxID=69181 RepID=A0ABQ7EPY8_BRACR|nr:hypothetical protein DY000_02049820 [Brassica cretica]